MRKTADVGRMTGDEASRGGCVPTDREGNAEALSGLEPRLWVPSDMNMFLRVPL